MKFRARICTVVACALFLTPSLAPAQSLRVRLLGTGNPEPLITRFGPSILVEAGTHKMLFDNGRGAMIRLGQLGISPGDIRLLFLTHLHSDHIVGISDLLLTGWLRGRNTPLQVFGPDGTEEMMRHLRQAYQVDVRFRTANQRSPKGVEVIARDITEGVAWEEDGVKVTAFTVDHGTAKPAFGYRIDYAGRSVVLSGDTGPTENLVRFAQGVDLLVHEVSIRRIRPGAGGSTHTTPEEAGRIFSRVKPRLAVYSHIIPPDAPAEQFIAQTRKTYSGPLEMGEDLMTIEVGDKIQVTRFHHGTD